MPDGWVDDMVEAYRLNGTTVLEFLKETFPQGEDSDFNVRFFNDTYQFQVPEKLNDERRQELLARREPDEDDDGDDYDDDD